MSLSTEILKLQADTVVELFEIDFVPFGGSVVRFHNGTNAKGENLIWKGNVYLPRAMEARGFNRDAQGRVPRPKLSISNVGGIMTEFINQLGGDIAGCKFTRRRTLAKFLDEANFPPKVNRVPLSNKLDQWVSNGTVVTSASNIYSPDGYADSVKKVVKATSVKNQYLSMQCEAAPSAEVTFRLAVRSLQENGKITFGVIQGASWHQKITAKIVEGPGVLVDSATVKTTVAFLSEKKWTVVEVSSNQFTVGAPVEFRVYPDTEDSIDAGAGNYVCSPMLTFDLLSHPYEGNDTASLSPNPTADPTQEFPIETWIIDRKSLETKVGIDFELASPFDRPGCLLPARQIVPNCCNWIYRQEGCGYTGGPVADESDTVTSDPTKDKCSHTLRGCKLRYGVDGVLPYGGEPAAGAYR